MACLDDSLVLRLIQGGLGGDELSAADGHLDRCAACRALIAAVARGRDPSEAPATDELRRGDAVDRYVVLGRLGSGAMGVVYAAHDAELDRKVALKLLRPEAGGGRDRLLREAQSMARLQHPNVVAVHDVGTAGDQVFVAMELVDGPTLRTWAVARPWRARLAAVRAVGHGLAAAHAAGLVHRDVKPDNVIVGADDRPRIGDFGLAQTAPGERARPPDGALVTTLTRTGTVIGTPAYMAPEQLRGGPASAASDQFGLAVTAWEVLVGTRPFDGRDLAELAAAIARGPAAPGRAVPASITRALTRALAVDPSARWPSVDALVAALAWQPRRPWRWLAPLATAAIAVAIFWLVRPGVTPVDPCRAAAGELAPAWSSSVEAVLRARLAAGGDAVSAERLAAWAARWRIARVTICQATRVRGAQSEGLLDVRQRCLERGRTELAALTDVLARTEPGAVAHVTDAVDALTEPDECAGSPALALLAPVPVAQRAAVAAVEREVAGVRARLVGAGPIAPDHGAALVRAAAATGHAPTLARAHLVEAEVRRRAGDYAGADRAARASIVAAERGHDDLGAARAWIARLGAAGDRRDLGAADEWLQLASAAIDRAGAPPELRARLANGAGLLAMNLGRLDDAERELATALALRQALAGDRPDVAVARTLSGLGHVARLRGDPAGARARHAQALAIDRAALGGDHPDVGRDLHNLAGVLRLAGELDQAERHYREALAIRSRALGADHPEVGLTHNSLGLVALDRGAHDDAARELEAARRIFAAAGHGDLAIAQANLGTLARRRGDLAAALGWFEQAIAGYRGQLPPRHERLARALLDAADAARAGGQRARARTLVSEARAAIPDSDAGAVLAGEVDQLLRALERTPPPAVTSRPSSPARPPTPPTKPEPPAGSYGSAQGWD